MATSWNVILCGFAHNYLPCSKMYFTISRCPVLVAWWSTEQWSGPWINRLAPLLQHSMNWNVNAQEEDKKTIGQGAQVNKHAGKLTVRFTSRWLKRAVVTTSQTVRPLQCTAKASDLKLARLTTHWVNNVKLHFLSSGSLVLYCRWIMLASRAGQKEKSLKLFEVFVCLYINEILGFQLNISQKVFAFCGTF